MTTFRIVDCECGNPCQISEGEVVFTCEKCNKAKMIFKRPSSNDMIKKWQTVLGCTKQEASIIMIEMLGEIAKIVQEKEEKCS